MSVIWPTRRAWRPPSKPVARNSSTMATARPSPRIRPPRPSTLASLCWRARRAVYSSWQRAARTPRTLLAAIVSPCPLPPSTMAKSARPATTARPAAAQLGGRRGRVGPRLRRLRRGDRRRGLDGRRCRVFRRRRGGPLRHAGGLHRRRTREEISEPFEGGRRRVDPPVVVDAVGRAVGVEVHDGGDGRMRRDPVVRLTEPLLLLARLALEDPELADHQRLAEPGRPGIPAVVDLAEALPLVAGPVGSEVVPVAADPVDVGGAGV